MRRILRWLVPAVLLAGVLAGGAVAWRNEAAVPEPRDPGTPEPALVTPVLSVRRVPTVVAAPIAERRLLADLENLSATFPSDTCLAVAGPGLSFAHRADVSMVPASTQKLLTATAALEVLDPQVRFRTTAMAGAAPAGGTIAGDLTVVGGGDPLLSTADYSSRFRRQPRLFTDLDTLAAAIAAAGVGRIEGSVVADEQRYDAERYVAGWPQRYIDQDSIGPLSAAAVNDGFATYPTSAEPSTELTPAAQPAAEAAAVLTRLLEARGVDVVGAPRAGAAPDGGVELAAVESDPLIDIIGQLLRDSSTNTAELLLKEIGRTDGTPTTSGGAAVVTEVLSDLGSPRVIDGSGLSLDDQVTCQLLVDVLQRPDTGPVIDDLLAVAGESGTLAERFVGTDIVGILRAKTGTLNSVSSLAGVVEDDDPPLAFAFIVNVPPPGRFPDDVFALQQQLGEVLASWPRVPDVVVLGPRVEED